MRRRAGGRLPALRQRLDVSSTCDPPILKKRDQCFGPCLPVVLGADVLHLRAEHRGPIGPCKVPRFVQGDRQRKKLRMPRRLEDRLGPHARLR